ncbi:alpha-ketoacid dehydrogenase subunit beta [Vallitalea pronyensis]|uniref:Alpha-ketoacid dehydrogenase subunit beta n=1 Tax=Vallitalea pronyensis TaxID=1348613 RepID=A0A8J8MQ17_9FIRM|nr:alpha-ketoacid dehydrogenase subunit beta [Vallitalea pronyensis]QUI25283.1 alpha-ketoacid dehydrogenase subunit beta [Vallitalea pronyensis]
MERMMKTKDAINEAIAQEMRRDETVIILGEDIAGGATNKGFENKSGLGGAYGVTAGLVEEFGRKRVIDTPISETAFLGMGIGAAFAGLKPIIEIMYVDFIGVCYDQLYNQAAKMFYLYGGQNPIPLVLRMPVGAGYQAGAEHSQTLYSLFASIPGLKVVTPSNAYDAKGLMLQAIKDKDPVVFLEHKRIYMMESHVPEEMEAIPFGKASIKRSGDDVTIIAVHNMVNYALEAAEKLQEKGIGVEVIDPRTISPLDLDTIIESVKKTGRVLVTDEGYPRCGLSSDIAAQVTEQAFDALKAPVKTVTPPHAHIPYLKELEKIWVPSADKIAVVAEELYNS